MMPFTIETVVTDVLALDPANFIEGERVASDDSATLPVFDPSSGRIIAQAVDATA